jgi:Outer membrane lipoprotein-sorting protein
MLESEWEMRKTKVLALMILISLALFASGCEEELGAEEIAKKMQEKGESIEDYSCIIHTATYANGEKVQENEERVISKKPNMMKSWTIEQGKEEVASVSDGKFLWSYDEGTNTVTKIKLPEKPLINESDYVGLIEGFLNKTNVSLLGVEEVDGRSAYVLEAKPEAENEGYILISRTKMWVDKETWMALRCEMYDSKENLVTETEISDLEVNTGIPDSEFEFEVPAGAEIKVIDLEDFEAPEKMSLEEAREKASFEILIPEYVPEGYVFNYAAVGDNYETVPESQGSETVLNYQRGDEFFLITQTIYEDKPEEDVMLAQRAENISINRKEGKYINQLGDFKILRWNLGEIEMTLSGSLEKAEMLKIAESIPEPASGKNKK